MLGVIGGYQESFSLYSQVKIEEPVSMEMDNHLSDKDESCYDNAEAAFSDDEEDLNSKGKVGGGQCLRRGSQRGLVHRQPACSPVLPLLPMRETFVYC